MQKLIISTSLVLALGCGGANRTEAEAPSGAAPEPANATAADPSGPSAVPATFADQVALGQSLYGANCAGCHGASGEGGKAPKVVGLKDGALPLDPPATAQQMWTAVPRVSGLSRACGPSNNERAARHFKTRRCADRSSRR